MNVVFVALALVALIALVEGREALDRFLRGERGPIFACADECDAPPCPERPAALNWRRQMLGVVWPPETIRQIRETIRWGRAYRAHLNECITVIDERTSALRAESDAYVAALGAETARVNRATRLVREEWMLDGAGSPVAR